MMAHIETTLVVHVQSMLPFVTQTGTMQPILKSREAECARRAEVETVWRGWKKSTSRHASSRLSSLLVLLKERD